MTTDEQIKYWLETADHDADTAESLFISCKYDWCLFVSVLSIEKILKAFFARDNDNRVPPKSHNLVRLAEKTKIDFSQEQLVFLSEISDFNIEVRYPEFKNAFYKRCTKEFAAGYYDRIKELRQWLLSLIR